MEFIYSLRVQAFLSDRVDENPEYAECIRVFEFMVGRNKKIGDPLKKFLPISVRLFRAIVPNLEPIAFSYYYEGQDGEIIRVIDASFLRDVLT